MNLLNLGFDNARAKSLFFIAGKDSFQDFTRVNPRLTLVVDQFQEKH